jgi:alpha-L-rhamnosidase
MKTLAKTNKVVFLFALLVFCMSEACAKPSFIEAKPIWQAGSEKERNLFLGFRTSFDSLADAKAILRITGCSSYRITFNGKYVGYGPARAAKGYFRLDEIPLEVKAGTNALAIEVAGYNCVSFYHMNQPSFLQAEVVLNGKVVAATGKCGSFKAARLPRTQKVVRYSFQRTYSEHYSIDMAFDNWKNLGSPFEEVAIAEQPEIELLPRRAPYPNYEINGPFKKLSTAKIVFDAAMKTRSTRFVNADGPNGIRGAFKVGELASNWWDLIQRYSAKDRVAAADGGATYLAAGQSALFDAGLNDSGFIALQVKCLKPGTIAVKFDEVLVDGEVSPTRYSCANVVVWEFKEPGEYKVESFEPYTLRYADVLAVSGDFSVDALSMRTYKNPHASRARFESSDAELNKIFEAARETFAQNAVDVFSDCPGRERAGWLCDSFFTGRSSILFTGSLDMEELFLENYALVDKFDHLPSGMFAMCYPGDFPNGRFIPNWAMWLVFEVEEFKKRGGNPKLVEKFRPKLEALVEYMRSFRNSDGLLEKLPSWVFIEWSQANYLVQDVNYPSNMAWAEVLDAMDRLYAKPELRAEAQKMRQTIRRQSWTGKWFCDNAVRQKDGTLKLSGDSTETCQYYAFYFKTATPKTHPELWKTLVSDFGPSRIKTKKHKEIFPSNAFIGNYLRLECLAREGLTDKILDETKDFFLYMAERTGTLWENINISASCNHGFASHIAVTFARDIVGLKEVDYCAKKVKFTSPENIPVKNVSVKIPLDDGTYIEAGWSREGSKVSEKLKLPDGWSRICEGSKNNNDLQAD